MFCTALGDVSLSPSSSSRCKVDDHFFAVGTAAFESLIEAWLYLPAMVLLSQMCPAGLEAVLPNPATHGRARLEA